MAKNVYDGMFILNANRYGRDPEGVSGQLSQLVEKAGGEMLVSRLWEERRLAYPINGQRKGVYWMTYFRLDGPALAGVQRACDLNDSILRVLFLKVDPRIVDTLVAHAQSGRVTTGPATAAPATAGGNEADKGPRKREETAGKEAVAAAGRSDSGGSRSAEKNDN